MHKIILLLLVILVNVFGYQKVNAQLVLISFQPLKFNLTFSQPVPLPKFQFLFNQISLNYEVQQPNVNESSYIIKGDVSGIPKDYKTQKYVLMFTQPLKVAGGRLHLNSFLLRASLTTHLQYTKANNLSRKTYYYYQTENQMSNTLAIVIVAVVYFLAYTTLIGIHSYNFLAIYIYICLQTSFFTSLDYRCAYLLLFDPTIIPSEFKRFLYMIAPHFLIALSWTIGLISRKLLGRLARRSGLFKQIYYYFSYRLCLITWQIMCMPIIANLTYVVQKIITFSQLSPKIIYAYIYFSVAVVALYSYMAYFSVNPQIGQSQQKWHEYIESDHFQLYYGIHLGIDAENKKKRNFSFIVSVFRIIIIIFVTLKLVNVPNMLLQIAYLIYLFTLRPFKYDFLNQCIIVIQIFIILFYMYRYVSLLYAEISDEVLTSVDVSNILLSNIVILCIVIFTYCILGVYQFYQRINVFRANIHVWAYQIQQKKKQYQIQDENRTDRSELKRLNSKENSLLQSKEGQKQHPDMKRQSKLKRSNSPSKSLSPSTSRKKIQKKQSTQSKRSSNMQFSSGYHSPLKSSKRIKEKSSLLQTIGLGHQAI